MKKTIALTVLTSVLLAGGSSIACTAKSTPVFGGFVNFSSSFQKVCSGKLFNSYQQFVKKNRASFVLYRKNDIGLSVYDSVKNQLSGSGWYAMDTRSGYTRSGAFTWIKGNNVAELWLSGSSEDNGSYAAVVSYSIPDGSLWSSETFTTTSPGHWVSSSGKRY